MRTYSTADLNKQVGEVTNAASKGPVTITWRRKPRFVIMSYEHYQRISKQADPRWVYGAGEPTDDVAAQFAGVLDRLAKGQGYDDEP